MMVRHSVEALASADIVRDIAIQIRTRPICALSAPLPGKLGIEENRTIATVAEYGNSSAATIPLSLSRTKTSRCDGASCCWPRLAQG